MASAEVDLDGAHAFAVQLAKDAGSLLMKAAQARFDGSARSGNDFEEKESAVDIVTKTDEGRSPASSLRATLPLYPFEDDIRPRGLSILLVSNWS